MSTEANKAVIGQVIEEAWNGQRFEVMNHS